MKLKNLLLIGLLFGSLAGCYQHTDPQRAVSLLRDHLVYTEDVKTGLCFAVLFMHSAGADSASVTNVNCENAKKSNRFVAMAFDVK